MDKLIEEWYMSKKKTYHKVWETKQGWAWCSDFTHVHVWVSPAVRHRQWACDVLESAGRLQIGEPREGRGVDVPTCTVPELALW